MAILLPFFSSAWLKIQAMAIIRGRGTMQIYILFQVRKRPLNKKEIAKKEDDIITVSNNSLTVHETKLKVRVCASLKITMTSMIQFNEMKGHRPSSFYVYFSGIE